MINIKHLKKNFGSNEVLKDIELEINAGEVVAIIGPSGGGKSTLLRCINLLEQPDGGEINFEGTNILGKDVKVNELRQKMGMVFQNFNLFPHKTVLENIMLAPKLLKHTDSTSLKQEAQELLDKVGLSDKGNSYPAQLSGGQKQRVARQCIQMYYSLMNRLLHLIQK